MLLFDLHDLFIKSQQTPCFVLPKLTRQVKPVLSQASFPICRASGSVLTGMFQTSLLLLHTLGQPRPLRGGVMLLYTK